MGDNKRAAIGYTPSGEKKPKITPRADKRDDTIVFSFERFDSSNKWSKANSSLGAGLTFKKAARASLKLSGERETGFSLVVFFSSLSMTLSIHQEVGGTL